MKSQPSRADVCLILEGTYPYVYGGVSAWVRDLLNAHKDLTFHLVCLMPDRNLPKRCFDIPGNVLSLEHIFLEQLPEGQLRGREVNRLLEEMGPPLTGLLSRGNLCDLAGVMSALSRCRRTPGAEALLTSRGAWQVLHNAYDAQHPGSSFIDFYWSWQALLKGLFSVLLAPLPPARVYHVTSTGYAGLFAARAHVETGRPAIVTEHGIYTNERRIELAMCEWLHDRPIESLAVGSTRRELKDLWVDAFVGYSRACYQACERIITLYKANQLFQLEDGAPEDRLEIIPNGIDYEQYAEIKPSTESRPPTIALIGRVVPIKDIKTYIRSCAHLRKLIPDLKALVLGPTDEDPEYYADCQEMIRHLGLQSVIEFTGRVRLTDYLGKVDALALTSISEAQPLVILEGGAAAVPTVATDVGSCSELLLGRDDEDPPLGAGGAIVPLANPQAVAQEMARILGSQQTRDRCGKILQERVKLYYNKVDLDAAYHKIYAEAGRAPARQPALAGTP